MNHGLRIPVSPERLQNDLIDALEEGFRKKWEQGELNREFVALLSEFLSISLVQERLKEKQVERFQDALDGLCRAMFPVDKAE